MEFKEFQLGDLVKYNNDKISVFEAKKESYISTENMLAEKRGVGDIAKLPEKGKVNVYADEDILISNIRPYFKKIWFANSIGSHSSDVLNLRVTNEKVLPKYLYYYVFQDRFFEFMTSSSKGTKMPRGDKQTIMKYPVLLPDIRVQSKIVSILSNLDDKIQNNLEIIYNLEQISQTLFKRWFIDFEFPNEDGKPYKSSGGEMVESELGEIPKGWEVGKLNDYGEVVGGGTPSKKNNEFYINGTIPWITPKDLSNNKNRFIYKGKLDITELGLKKSSAKLLPKNSILYSSRAPIGYIAIAADKLTTNQGFKSLVPNNENHFMFIYELFKWLTPTIISLSGGSTFKEISGSTLKNINVVIPQTEKLNDFSNISTKLFECIKIKEAENSKLENIRDTLLPKLLSGEIEIPEDLEV